MSNDNGVAAAPAKELSEEDGRHRRFFEKEEIIKQDGKTLLVLSGGRSFFYGDRWLVTRPRVMEVVSSQPPLNPRNDVRNNIPS